MQAKGSKKVNANSEIETSGFDYISRCSRHETLVDLSEFEELKHNLLDYTMLKDSVVHTMDTC